MKDRQGEFVEWTWNELRECWEYFTPHRIYLIDGKFTVSSCDVWHDGSFDNFGQAELEALVPAQHRKG